MHRMGADVIRLTGGTQVRRTKAQQRIFIFSRLCNCAVQLSGWPFYRCVTLLPGGTVSQQMDQCKCIQILVNVNLSLTAEVKKLQLSLRC